MSPERTPGSESVGEWVEGLGPPPARARCIGDQGHPSSRQGIGAPLNAGCASHSGTSGAGPLTGVHTFYIEGNWTRRADETGFGRPMRKPWA